MSQVLLYLYRTGKPAPEEHRVQNANVWLWGLSEFFDGGRNLLRQDYDKVRKPAYNAFQQGPAPRWQKVAAAFQTDYTCVLDNDRVEVSDALKRTFDMINNGTIETTIKDVGDKILQLEKGTIIIANSFVNPVDVLYTPEAGETKPISIDQLTRTIPRPVNVPLLWP